MLQFFGGAVAVVFFHWRKAHLLSVLEEVVEEQTDVVFGFGEDGLVEEAVGYLFESSGGSEEVGPAKGVVAYHFFFGSAHDEAVGVELGVAVARVRRLEGDERSALGLVGGETERLADNAVELAAAKLEVAIHDDDSIVVVDGGLGDETGLYGTARRLEHRVDVGLGEECEDALVDVVTVDVLLADDE